MTNSMPNPISGKTGVADGSSKPVADSSGVLPAPNTVICACAGFDFARLQQAVGKLHSHSFETLLEKTGAGQTCTACLLDLEYYFVALKAQAEQGSLTPSGDIAGVDSGQKQARSLKRRVYDWLDSLSPPVAWSPPNRIPVMSGRDIETWLTITNHDLLFERRMTAPLTSTVVVRRADGTMVWRRRFRVPPGDELRTRLDDGLCPAGSAIDPFCVGSAQIETRAEHPAMRGTMRPQLEIVASAGTCALHAQGDSGPGDAWFTVQNRPDDERLFLIVMNTSGRAQTATITYPHGVRSEDANGDVSKMIPLAPRGTALHEVRVPDEGQHVARPSTYGVRTRAERACRIYLVCASPALDRFSIDHR